MFPNVVIFDFFIFLDLTFFFVFFRFPTSDLDCAEFCGFVFLGFSLFSEIFKISGLFEFLLDFVDFRDCLMFQFFLYFSNSRFFRNLRFSRCLDFSEILDFWIFCVP